MKPELKQKIKMWQFKALLFIRVLWGLLVVFCIVGMVTQPNSEVPLVVAGLTAIAWVLLRILHEAEGSLKMLQALAKEKPEADTTNDPPAE